MASDLMQTVTRVVGLRLQTNDHTLTVLRPLVAVVIKSTASPLGVTRFRLTEQFVERYWRLALLFPLRQAAVADRDPVVMRRIRKEKSDLAFSDEMSVHKDRPNSPTRCQRLIATRRPLFAQRCEQGSRVEISNATNSGVPAPAREDQAERTIIITGKVRGGTRRDVGHYGRDDILGLHMAQPRCRGGAPQRPTRSLASPLDGGQCSAASGGSAEFVDPERPSPALCRLGAVRLDIGACGAQRRVVHASDVVQGVASLLARVR